VLPWVSIQTHRDGSRDPRSRDAFERVYFDAQVSHMDAQLCMKHARGRACTRGPATVARPRRRRAERGGGPGRHDEAAFCHPDQQLRGPTNHDIHVCVCARACACACAYVCVCVRAYARARVRARGSHTAGAPEVEKMAAQGCQDARRVYGGPRVPPARRVMRSNLHPAEAGTRHTTWGACHAATPGCAPQACLAAH
jgi:hypothetical protein